VEKQRGALVQPRERPNPFLMKKSKHRRVHQDSNIAYRIAHTSLYLLDEGSLAEAHQAAKQRAEKRCKSLGSGS